MPKLTKMSQEEVQTMQSKKSGAGQRQRIRKQYQGYLKDYGPGDWVSVALEEGENRQTVKNRLKAAANELGFELNFARSRGVLRFEIRKAKK